MENKLQQLTEKLYNDGLEKGRAEADRLVSDAKNEAEKLLEQAKAKAQSIIDEAKKQAADIEKNSMTEITLAGREAVAKIKAEIASAIVMKSIGEGVKSANIDPEFIKSMLLDVAKNWNGASATKIELKALLPESRRAELDGVIAKSATELMSAGIEVGYAKHVNSGFKVAPKNGGYYISFSDEDFDTLLGSYLREKVSNLLFKA